MKIGVLGASGRTGRAIVKQALLAGHQVRALVRSPEKFGEVHERLEVVKGDVTNAEEVARLVAGCDAVVSSVGPVASDDAVCSRSTANVIAAGAKRYVAESGAGIDVPGDQKDFIGKMVSFVVARLTPGIHRDKVREYELLAASPLAWTLVRPPRLVDAPGQGKPRMSLERAPGNSIAREDLAKAVLECLLDDSMIRKAPFVAS